MAPGNGGGGRAFVLFKTTMFCLFWGLGGLCFGDINTVY